MSVASRQHEVHCLVPSLVPCRQRQTQLAAPSPRPQERSELLSANRSELEGLLEKRSKAETDFLERYLATVESYQKQLEDVRNSDLEDYNILKAK